MKTNLSQLRAGFARSTAIFALSLALTGCNTLTRLSEMGQEPQMSKIGDPTQRHDYQPIEMPMPEPEVANISANSLWRTGSRGFFKDQRASQIGDILTVTVQIKDTALLKNKSEQIRGTDTDTTKINALAGLEKYAKDILPETVNPANLFDVTSSRNMSGEGNIDRGETVQVTLAATITQILPNGNLVIQGKQEVRVNYEMRELLVNGIVRRADITSQNSVSSDKIAELRVAYGGRGTISDVQQPRYGRQLIDILNPF